MLETVRWKQLSPDSLFPGKLRLIDQTKLPEELVYIETDNAKEIYDCIKRLSVRGAPAIGCGIRRCLRSVVSPDPRPGPPAAPIARSRRRRRRSPPLPEFESTGLRRKPVVRPAERRPTILRRIRRYNC